MIENATILRIDTPGTPTTGGDPTWVNGSAVSVPCAVDEISYSNRWVLGAAIADATRALYVACDAVTLAEGYRVVIRAEGEAQKTMRVLRVQHRILNDASHWECFLAE